MNLYLLRHGLAVEFGTPGYRDDARRPLLPKGIRRMKEIARAMVALELEFDLILASPYVRARQTAEIVATELSADKRLEFSPTLVPGVAYGEVVDCLSKRKPLPNSVLLVGHEPNLSQLISALVSGGTGFALTMKKGGLCKLTIETLKRGRCATLEWLLAPKQLCLMA